MTPTEALEKLYFAAEQDVPKKGAIHWGPFCVLQELIEEHEHDAEQALLLELARERIRQVSADMIGRIDLRGLTLLQVQDVAIELALMRHRSPSKAARALGMGRATLYRWIAKHGWKREVLE